MAIKWTLNGHLGVIWYGAYGAHELCSIFKVPSSLCVKTCNGDITWTEQ